MLFAVFAFHLLGADNIPETWPELIFMLVFTALVMATFNWLRGR